MWALKVSKSAAKSLKLLPKSVQEIVLLALEALKSEGPVPKHWDVLQTDSGEYRLRLNYRYRMRYRADKRVVVIEVFYIGHRKDAYR